MFKLGNNILDICKSGLTHLFLDLLLPVVLLLIIYLSNLIVLPLARIPVGKKNTYKLKVQLKALYIACPYRDLAEEVLGNKLLFFSKESSLEAPTYLYIKKKSLKTLPLELITFKGFEAAKTEDKTLILEVITRKSLLCGYLPAKVLNYEISTEKPDFVK